MKRNDGHTEYKDQWHLLRNKGMFNTMHHMFTGATVPVKQSFFQPRGAFSQEATILGIQSSVLSRITYSHSFMPSDTVTVGYRWLSSLR